MNLSTKRIILLVSGYCTIGLSWGARATESREVLRDKRQAIYREFGFALRVNVLEETCDQLAADQHNIDLLWKINAEVENLKPVFARYADALLACVKAGDLAAPEEFYWAGHWGKINRLVCSRAAELYDRVMADITAQKDPADTVDCAKTVFEMYLRDGIAVIIGQNIIDRCAEQK